MSDPKAKGEEPGAYMYVWDLQMDGHVLRVYSQIRDVAGKKFVRSVRLHPQLGRFIHVTLDCDGSDAEPILIWAFAQDEADLLDSIRISIAHWRERGRPFRVMPRDMTVLDPITEAAIRALPELVDLTGDGQPVGRKA